MKYICNTKCYAMINMEKEVFYTIEEVAIMLKVAYLTVYRWIQSGRLEAVKAGKQYRIRQSQLDDFLINYKK